ncbi:sialate O-acetylesterase [Hymenobacter sp. YC55]|uniref:sialate O-acetylesterase n=1 Tax=Hymenobacter sp. YC55 TaxID=3034019 RepID=UPI0023F7A209|nr:sialate O-acetylesterase [Hymenobacter sp. YC55]MDF7810692.1 sialate O-acetylesterase [Hymenobacter sp. YC55]
MPTPVTFVINNSTVTAPFESNLNVDNPSGWTPGLVIQAPDGTYTRAGVRAGTVLRVWPNPVVVNAGSGSGGTPTQTVELLGIGGQSNAYGQSPQAPLYSPPLSQVNPSLTREFQRVYMLNDDTNTFQKLKVDVNTHGNNEGGDAVFGPEIGYAQQWEASNTTGNLYIWKFAVGGQPITNLNKGTANYTELLERYTKAKNLLLAQSLAPRPHFYWMQGESGGQEAGYATLLAQMMADVTADMLNANSIKVLGAIKKTLAGDPAQARANQLAYVNSDPQARFLTDTVNYPLVDDFHYSAAAQISCGQNVYRLIHGQAIVPFSEVVVNPTRIGVGETVQESDSRIVYDAGGAWQTANNGNPAWYGGGIKFVQAAPGRNYSFPITGPQIELGFHIAEDGGPCEVLADGNVIGTFTTKSATGAPGQKWTSPVLSNGEHQIIVRPTAAHAGLFWCDQIRVLDGSGAPTPANALGVGEVIQENDPRITYSGNFAYAPGGGFYGGGIQYASSAGAFYGLLVNGPSRVKIGFHIASDGGLMEILNNGVPIGTFSTYDATGAPFQSYTSPVLPNEYNTITVRRAAGSGAVYVFFDQVEVLPA